MLLCCSPEQNGISFIIFILANFTNLCTENKETLFRCFSQGDTSTMLVEQNEEILQDTNIRTILGIILERSVVRSFYLNRSNF